MKIAIIGGGASGLMAGIMLKRQGQDVTLFEKNNMLGKKILITGKGRCNVTNNSTGADFLNNVVRGAQFLRSAEANFNSQNTMDFFESLGVKLKVERGNRVFPVSDRAQDIVKALSGEFKRLGGSIALNAEVQQILQEDGKLIGVKVNDEVLPFDAVIVATGGKSYPLTGSSGDGYKFAQKLGHSITEIAPALNGIEIKGTEPKQLEGLSLKNVKVSAYKDSKIIYESEIGEMLFTNVGISGPLVLTMSSYINREKVSHICINFKPALSQTQLENKIDRLIEENPVKQLGFLLGQMLPKRLIEIFAKRMNLGVQTKINQLSREKRLELTNLLFNFKLNFKRVEPVETSVITSGGVNLKEINPKDMSSKLVKGLFFIGEVLDIDAVTGGFNLQVAFSTAVACANSKFFANSMSCNIIEEASSHKLSDVTYSSNLISNGSISKFFKEED